MDKIFTGDSLAVLKSLKNESVQTCVTSPPYFGLRDYGMKKQMGLEETPDAYVANMVVLFRQVKRVLRDNGTLWLNLGDSYGKGKQLLGIPWRVAFALQADGWYLRQDIIWAKPNPMPESVTDRCTKAHEYIFLLSKSPKYYFDSVSMQEPAVSRATGAAASFKRSGSKREQTIPRQRYGTHRPDREDVAYNKTRNRRSVWTIATRPYKGAHFATFPPALIEPCILAGAPKDGIVLDPFFGSGTTGAVAKSLGRQYIGIDLNPAYVTLAKERLASVQLPLAA
jgi:DNA modification methylase